MILNFHCRKKFRRKKYLNNISLIVIFTFFCIILFKGCIEISDDNSRIKLTSIKEINSNHSMYIGTEVNVKGYIFHSEVKSIGVILETNDYKSDGITIYYNGSLHEGWYIINGIVVTEKFRNKAIIKVFNYYEV
jgi:hypothetical protein